MTATYSTRYCETHAAACESLGRDFGPFPGCRDCPKPDGFDLRTQPHLFGPRSPATEPPPGPRPQAAGESPVHKPRPGVCGTPGCEEDAVLYPCGWRCPSHKPGSKPAAGGAS